MSHSPRRARAALEALCRRIVPAAWEADPPVDIVAHVEQRIASLDAAMRRDVIGALHFFDHPITGMLLSGRPRRFSTLPPAEQDALLHEWERSSLALRRTVFQALRRLILATYYTLPSAHRAIGYLPPLHLREPRFAWEGPAPGVSTGDEPIAREHDAATSHADAAVVGANRTPSHADAAVATNAHGTVPAASPHTHGVNSGAEIPADSRLRADVCVVGSGAGGSVAAARLAEAGYEVIVVEEGGYYTNADFDDDEGRLAPSLYADGAARATDDLSMVLLQGRCVGGGTTVNWLMTLRPQPWVMHEWEREYGVELLSERVFGPALACMEETIHARPVPDDAHSPSNRVILDGCAQLGWNTLEARINTRGCVRSGSCGLGCRWGAKQNALTVFLPRAIDAGARVLCDVRADRLEITERHAEAPLKRVYCTVVDRTTREPRSRFTIEAPIVVLAGGAVGTPALLERSGLGGGAVGRWLRVHPTTGVFGRFAEPVYAAAGVPQSAVCAEFLHGADGYGFWVECPPLRPGLAAAALQGFGDEHRARMQNFAHFAPLIVLVRDGADRERCAGDVRVDRTGRTRIRYRVTAADRRTLMQGIQAAARLQFAAGADHALTLHVGARPIRTARDIDNIALQSYGPNRLSLFSAHLNGTCRMGTDPQTAACTTSGERYGAPGVWVADGSLFPTAPGVNPQLAIMTLAGLVADRILERRS